MIQVKDHQKPVTKYNAYSCALASVVFEAQKSGRIETQEDIVAKHGKQFAKWQNAPGIMNAWEILKLLALMDLEPSQFLATKSFEEAARYCASSQLAVFAAFYWIRFHPDDLGTWQPVNHCMALMDIDPVLNQIRVMDPEPGAGFPRTISFAEHQSLDGTLLLCACPKTNETK